MFNDISVYDWQTLFILIEAVAWVAIVFVGILFLTQLKTKLLTKGKKQILWLIFAAWAIASIGYATLNTYSYFSTSRDGFVQSIEAQKTY